MRDKENDAKPISPENSEKDIRTTMIKIEELAEMIGQFYGGDSIEILAIENPENSSGEASANDELPAVDNSNVIPLRR